MKNIVLKIIGAKVVKITVIHDYIQLFLVKDEYKEIIVNIYSNYEYNECLSSLLKQVIISIKRTADKIIFQFSDNVLSISLNSMNEILEVIIDKQNEIIWE